MRRMLWMPWVVLACATLFVASSEGQMDPAKVLVGKWEGEVQFLGVGGERDRTLIIESVSQKDGKWVGQGRWGITGKGLGPVTIEVDHSGKMPWIRFVSSAGAVVRLDLFDAKHLIGTLAVAGAASSGRGAERTLKLEKKE
jgi:hypothetical protein